MSCLRRHCRVGGASQNAVYVHSWLLGSLPHGFSSIWCTAQRDTAGKQGVLSKKTISLGEIMSFTVRMSRDSVRNEGALLILIILYFKQCNATTASTVERKCR